MDKKEQLSAVIDSFIKGDSDAAKAAFAPYIQAKTRDILGYKDTPIASVETKVEEAFAAYLGEGVLDDTPIRFVGDEVYVDGKPVGVVQSDPTDFESGIKFIEGGGKFTTEYDSLEDLFDLLIKRYAKRGDV